MDRAGFGLKLDRFGLNTDPDPYTGFRFRFRVLAAVEVGFAEGFSVDDTAFAAPISAVGSLTSEIVRQGFLHLHF